jgi:small GTP-binding protein
MVTPSSVCFKAVLLGESTVGKTSLIARWISGIFHRQTQPTIGANHQRKRVQLEDTEVEISVWDTAGQEQFQALTPLYARSASVAIIVTDISKPTSFDRLDHWTELLRQSNERIPPIVLAINKIDLADHLSEQQEELTQSFGPRFAGLFFVSALTSVGIDDLFHFAAVAGYEFASAATKPDAVVSLPPAGGGENGCC